MSVLSNLFSDIALAIRLKTGEIGTMKPAQFAGKIAGITGTSADLRYVTFMSQDGKTELGKKAVAVGDDCADPIARGLFSAPAKESTAQFDYVFAGWSRIAGGGLDDSATKAVTEDRTVYAAFAEITRYYFIRYWDGDSLLKTVQLPYGTVPEAYFPLKVGYVLEEWVPAVTAVTKDMDYQAQWIAAETVVGSGTAGEGITWTFTSGGTLTLSGTGAPVVNSFSPPWASHLTNIKHFVVEAGITEVPSYTCAGISDSGDSIKATNLERITLPAGITKIGDFAFRYCSKLKSIELPDAVEEIGHQAFSACSSLETVTIGRNMKKLYNSAFGNCLNITRVNCPSLECWMQIEVASWSANPLYGGNAVLYLNGDSLVGNVVVPESITGISQNAFYNYTHITGVVIHGGVTTIGANAFYSCTNLTSATFENPIGWSVSGSATATEWTPIDIPDAATGATLLRSTYRTKYWRRSE